MAESVSEANTHPQQNDQYLSCAVDVVLLRAGHAIHSHGFDAPDVFRVLFDGSVAGELSACGHVH